MIRRVSAFLFLTSFLVVGACGRTDKKSNPDDNLTLTLPKSVDPPKHAPDRVSFLKIDGKDFSEPRKTWRSLKVEPWEGKDSVVVEYTFWPNTYTKIIRSKRVDIVTGKISDANLVMADARDRVQPIFFPTPEEVVDEMCKLGKAGKGDVVYDIGCGDGRMVIRAVKHFGAKKGVGIDIDEDLVKKCQENAAEAGVADKVEFRAQDCQTIKDFSEASVVLLYLSEELMVKLEPVLKDALKPGSRIVSHRFLMGDWKPDQTVNIFAKNNYGEKEGYALHVWNIK